MKQEVIEANIALHTQVVDSYHKEPHFSKENKKQVEEKLLKLITETKAKKMLDLGCGTGFIINIARKFLEEIDGVDITPAMLEKIQTHDDGAKIKLFCEDTGNFATESNKYDLVTAYSFLHHLYEIAPTIRTAYKALKTGGLFYSDLDPNYYCWEALSKLPRFGDYHPTVSREIEMVTYKDEDIEQNFGVPKETFNKAEYGKNIKGGFKEEELREAFLSEGFQEVTISHHWFIGQRTMVRDTEKNADQKKEDVALVETVLKQQHPLSRHLFKYIGVVAKK